MANQWFEGRKELFFKDLVHTFLDSKIFFDQLYLYYRTHKSLPFERMDYWVGTEAKKGPLWILKDTCHMLFRKTGSKISLNEYIFDWTVGSIFHEGMKLKEDAYQLEVYLPSAESISAEDHTEDIEEALAEYVTVIEKAARNMGAEIRSMRYLFAKASERLKELLVNHAHNGLLVRFLLEHADLLERAFGKHSLRKVLATIYPQHPERAYFTAGKSYLSGGWYQEAKHYFTKALEMRSPYPEAQKYLRETDQKLSSGGST